MGKQLPGEKGVGGRWFYGGCFVALAAAFLAIIRQPWVMALPENDLWWMLPTLAQQTEGKSFLELARFLLGPWPIEFGQPVLKSYLFLVTVFANNPIQSLMGVSVVVYAATAALLYRVCRLMELTREVAFGAAVVFLTAFSHFYAVLWPAAFQHLFACFTILVVLSGYLQIEARPTSSLSGARWLYGWTLAWVVVASLQRSAVIAPLLIAAHLLVVSRDPKERLNRFNRWLPLFVAALVYPTFALAFAGDVIINDAIVQWAIPAGVKWGVLLALGGVALGAFRLLLKGGAGFLRHSRLGWIVLAISLGLVWGWLALRDTRQLLLPYNALSPLVTSLATFLNPLQTARLMDSSQAQHYIPAQMSLWAGGLTVLLIWNFFRETIKKRGALVVWGVWYGVVLVHLLNHYVSFPPAVPSRYMIYVTPILAVLLSLGLAALLGGISRRLGWAETTRHAFVVALFVLLAVPNLLAVRAELFRGRLVNTYLLYDDLRTADLIRRDVSASDRLDALEPREIAIQGVVAMPHQQLAPGHSHADSRKRQNFRNLLAAALRETSLEGVQVNLAAFQSAEVGYRIQGHLVFDERGRWVDPFGTRLMLGLKRLEQNKGEEAQRLLLQALQTRPFLLRHLLPSLPLSDLRWVTGGQPLRPWVRQMGDRYVRWGGRATHKQKRIQQVMEQEIWETIACLFALSYLEHRRGNAQMGRIWLSQIRFLESDPEMIIRQLDRIPQLASLDGIGKHLSRLRNPAYFEDPIPWRKDDYGFGRFLVRLVSGRNVQCAWERRLPHSI